MGLSSYASGDLAGAQKWFQAAVDDREAPAGLRERSEIMLNLIRSQTSADTTKGGEAQ